MIARLIGSLLLIAACSCSTGGGQNSDAATRISSGMQRLGASEARGDCYAERIASSLDSDGAEEAAKIAEVAQSKDEMRDGVLNASSDVRQAFIGANFGCGR